MDDLIFSDYDGDVLIISDALDYLCYMATWIDGVRVGISPHHAHKIIETLQGLIDTNNENKRRLMNG